MSYVAGRVKKVYAHTDLLKSLVIELNDDMDIAPGQFLMVWLPGYEEIPLSPSYAYRNIVRLTVKGVGETTNRLISLGVGDKIYARGPYGTPFKIEGDGKYLLVGGGYGAAPLIFLASKMVGEGLKPTYVEGVKTASEQLFIDEAKKLGLESVLVSEDGSSGVKGLVTDYVERIIDNYNGVMACGPNSMLDKILNLCRNKGIHCQLSYESIIKCGIGICGSCTLDGTGILICRDGPVLDIETLDKFGYMVE